MKIVRITIQFPLKLCLIMYKEDIQDFYGFFAVKNEDNFEN